MVGDALAEGLFLVDHVVGVTAGADADELLAGVELTSEDGEHVHAGEGFALEEDGDVVAVDLDAGGLVDGHGAGLMGGLLEHGGEAEELAVAGGVDDDLLVVLVDDGDVDGAGDHNVGVVAGIADLVDALAGSELFDLDLSGENGGFVLIEQGK